MFSLTIRTRMVNRSRTGADWLKAARLALLHRGPDAVRVEPLARGLGVTKGSFYWHFKDRNALLEALLRALARAGEAAEVPASRSAC